MAGEAGARGDLRAADLHRSRRMGLTQCCDRVWTEDDADTTNDTLNSRNDLTRRRSRFGMKVHVPTTKIDDDFVIEGSLGEGLYGCVRKGTRKSEEGSPRHLRQVRAIKEVRKKTAGQVAGMSVSDIHEEVAAMDILDHPNIARLFEVYQDHMNMYLVLEFCAGGDLFESIMQAENFSEKSASHIVGQVFQGLAHMHDRHVCHRDMKLDNLLLEGPEDRELDKYHIKIVDFGCAWVFKEGEYQSKKVGSKFYMAPEIFDRHYQSSIDLWACGVTAYILLSGRPPFLNEVAIRSKNLTFPSQDWKQITTDAKNLIAALIEREVSKRLTANQARQHQWITQGAPHAGAKQLHSVQPNLGQFTAHNSLKKAALKVVARNLDTEKIEVLRQTFLLADTNKDGTISRSELEQGLKATSLGEQLESVLAGVDLNGDGRIDYTEFLAASVEHKEYSQKGVCWRAFKAFDEDDSGRINREELAQVLQHEELQAVMGNDCIEQVFLESDQNGDGQIDFGEFFKMMGGASLLGESPES